MAIESIRWCETHDLPYSTIRTGDDRMVCWWIWWAEAMDRWSKLKDQSFPDLLEREVTTQTTCRSVNRVVMPTDRPLYEKCDHSEFTHNGRLRRLNFASGKHHVTFDETPDHSCHECRDWPHTKTEGWYCDGWVRVWPKVES